MAIFTNQATLSYNGTITNSNVAFGEILDVLAATKTSVEENYSVGNTVTYVVALRNTGNTALTNLTVSDDLGGYEFGGTTVYPLNFVDGSVLYYVNGVINPAPTVTAGPPLVITGINIPANSDAVIVYQTTVTNFANPEAEGVITNTVTVTGDGLNAPITATDTINALSEADLSISKSITPAQVVDNDRVTYTFIIQNTGNEAIVSTSDAVITDTFNPILTNLSVSYNGNAWTEGVNYNYDETTGLFTTLPTNITVPAATFVQDVTTGEYILTPGIATLTVEGTI
ncbi:MAG: hypothetical protein E7565_00990 [Ruminococcaceae bacterium]|nr:hypothetical protein [Oscillospiraceae bacterium]